MKQLPITNDPAFNFEVTLDGRNFKFNFKWNSEFEFYTFDIFNANDNLLLAGIKVVLNFDLLRPYQDPELPQGSIVAIDKTGDLDRVTREDFGSNIKLIYLTEQELNEIL